MSCCSPTAQKVYTFGISFILFLIGILLVTFWQAICYLVKSQELSLKSTNTIGYSMWKETPIPMYLEFYLFNLTNPEEYQKDPKNVKPDLQECGPYTFSEKHYRVEVKFNNNNTLTYKTKRVWHYLPEKTKGSLNDKIITINPVLATVGDRVKNSRLLQIAVNIFLKEKRVPFYAVHTVDEFLFKGFDDPMIDLIKKLNISQFNYPYDKFGWFYSRNNSEDYDGTFTMFTGADDLSKTGKFSLWNGESHTKFYGNYCNMVNGTSGEYWYPVNNDKGVSIFSPDLCSTLFLERDNNFEIHGVLGSKFVGTEKNIDNGTKYPELSCFSSGQPSGTRDVSKCKYGAPAFVSYPHFYLADPYYREAVKGMNPNKSKHEFTVSIEPDTGVPLSVRALIQLNLFIPQVKGITLLKNVKSIYFPLFWFRQSADLDEDLASLVKELLVLPSLLNYTGFAIIGIAILITFIGVIIILKKGWKGNDQEKLIKRESS